jgi:hypothetical protein
MFDAMVARFDLAFTGLLQRIHKPEEIQSLRAETSVRVIRHIQRVESLTDGHKKLVLRMLDDLIRANS